LFVRRIVHLAFQQSQPAARCKKKGSFRPQPGVGGPRPFLTDPSAGAI